MQDRPTALELLSAVRSFLEQDIVPALDGRRRFHTLVAANVLAIVERELTGMEASALHEWTSLAALLGVHTEPPQRLDALAANTREMTAALSERIRAGDADEGEFAERVRAHVRATVVEKLRVANPKMLGGR